MNVPFDSEVESLTHLTRSFAAASAFAEFPLSSDISEGSMVPGADFQRAHLSSPVPARRITSAICSQSFCRLAAAEGSAGRPSCNCCKIGSPRDLTLFAARCVWCKSRSSTNLSSVSQPMGVAEIVGLCPWGNALLILECAAWIITASALQSNFSSASGCESVLE